MPNMLHTRGMEPAQPLDDVLILSVVHLSSIRPCDNGAVDRLGNGFNTREAKAEFVYTCVFISHERNSRLRHLLVDHHRRLHSQPNQARRRTWGVGPLPGRAGCSASRTIATLGSQTKTIAHIGQIAHSLSEQSFWYL